MTCDLCTDDDGQGIHYHAFIPNDALNGETGKNRHYWACAACKGKLRLGEVHSDE